METIRFDYLNTFLTVARTHSFSLAAIELKTSQGTVSHHIAALEEYFDAELFKRTATGVDVTDAGATLKETAEKIIRQTHEAKAKISAAKQTLSGTIKIAASTIPEEHIIPGLIAEFQKKHPEIKFKIAAQDSLTSMSSLQTNSADFAAVGTILGFEEKFDFVEIGEEQLVLIVGCKHELADRKTVKLAENHRIPLHWQRRNQRNPKGSRETAFKKQNVNLKLENCFRDGQYGVGGDSGFRRQRGKHYFVHRSGQVGSCRVSEGCWDFGG